MRRPCLVSACSTHAADKVPVKNCQSDLLQTHGLSGTPRCAASDERAHASGEHTKVRKCKGVSACVRKCDCRFPAQPEMINTFAGWKTTKRRRNAKI